MQAAAEATPESAQTPSGELIVEVIKKNKKTESKYFRALCQIDRDAFDKHGDSGMIVKTFWKSTVNKIIVARRPDS